MKGVFVTGTDTVIGKTVVSAWLVRALDGDYWKPVQTGLAQEEGDSETVRRLSGLPGMRFHAPVHELQAALSPQEAARREGVEIVLDGFALPQSSRTLIVEGAGGVLAPLGEGLVMADLMRHLGLPVVLVAGTALGTINHSLLSLEALRARGLEIAGVVFCGPLDAANRGPGGSANREAVERFGEVAVIGEIPHLDPLDADAMAQLAKNSPPRFMEGGSVGVAGGGHG
ncbi:MAG: dethiobiotin synthase [Alphaproteobacteria bacterium]|nr:dethiobiotin synthase [Alphaproteobacteria bacterium]